MAQPHPGPDKSLLWDFAELAWNFSKTNKLGSPVLWFLELSKVLPVFAESELAEAPGPLGWTQAQNLKSGQHQPVLPLNH